MGRNEEHIEQIYNSNIEQTFHENMDRKLYEDAWQQDKQSYAEAETKLTEKTDTKKHRNPMSHLTPKKKKRK